MADTCVDIDERLLLRLLAAAAAIVARWQPDAAAVPGAAAPGAAGEAGKGDGRAGGLTGAVDLSILSEDRSAEVLRWTYIEELDVAPVRVLLTLSGSSDASGLLRKLGPLSKLPVFAFAEAFKASPPSSYSSPYASPAGAPPRPTWVTLQAMVSNLDRAPLLFRAVRWERPFLPRSELYARIAERYQVLLPIR